MTGAGTGAGMMSAAGASGAAAGASGGAAGAVAGTSGGAAGAAGGMSGAIPTTRPHDERMFTIDATMLAFDADPATETDRYHGVLDGAGYRIEVPKANWNGILVMYAHGYVGTVPALRSTIPSIRSHLLAQGYAWAASTYSKNYYDVRVGVEDTNKLALAFKRIVGEGGRVVEEPKKRYLIGHSMGGHITGAAIEKEAQMTAMNKVQYHAAMPMCGVMGDTELFNYFAAYQLAAQKVANTPVSMNPTDFAAVRQQTQDALFTTFPTVTTPAGDKVKVIVQNLTGGKRPMFDAGFASMMWQGAVWGTFGGDGTINGILDRSVVDTRMVDYQLDDDPAKSAEEMAFNMEVARSMPAENANPLRPDGLRWIPVINGEIDIPVLSLHTLGDLYVPFHMQQIYRQRVVAKGNGERLVQRAMRGVGHCEFTIAEQSTAFDALANWEQNGQKPEGDDVLDRNLLKDPNYGCKFTVNTFTATEMAGTVAASRGMNAPCP